MELNIIVKKIFFNDENTKQYIFEGLTTIKRMNSTGKLIKVKSKEKFKGIFMSLYVEDDIKVDGYWEDNEKYGKEFYVTSYKKNIPQTIKGIQTFLKQIVKGVGEKRVKVITDRYGEDTLNIIANNINTLDVIPNLSKEQKQDIWLAVTQNIEFENLLSFMQLNDINYILAIKIYNRFKAESVIQIKTNPYVLFSENIASFSMSDYIAKNLNIKINSDIRLNAAILSFIQDDVKNNGNLYTSVEFLKGYFNKYLKKNGKYDNSYFSEDEIDYALSYLNDNEKIIFDKTYADEKIIYLKNNLFVENKIVEIIKKKINTNCNVYDNDKILHLIKKYEQNKKLKIAKKQQEAIIAAFNNPISIITGGPGTGKTQTMAILIHCIKTLNPYAIIHLCSPTGKAAKRMNEMSGMNSSTIHRLVKIYDINNNKNETIISGDFIIVDEASMIDSFVFYKLISSLDENINLVIIGDYNQLPSVGPGLILRDLIDSNTIKTTKLTEIFRQAKNSKIITNSNIIINTGKTEGLTLSKKISGDFFFLEENSPYEIQDKIIEIMKVFIEKLNIPLSDIQVLSAIKGTQLGTEALNRLIQSHFNCLTNFIEIGENQFNNNDKVIHTTNNYDINVFNGETGIIKSLNYYETNMMTVKYGNKDVDYPKYFLDQLELAYAITVHKSQGSEFPVVIMPIHEILLKGLYRNLLYTAITRAKNKIIFVGSKKVFKEAIIITKGNLRNSRIREKLSNKK